MPILTDQLGQGPFLSHRIRRVLLIHCKTVGKVRRHQRIDPASIGLGPDGWSLS